ncbi:hypothetical protein [Streptomyces sp. NPDC094032]|uniref:hypothetical protein n=1 Tax=Streptomyces sp. NPDC094032 TaxID=3155308 RepID=UPI0033220F95
MPDFRPTHVVPRDGLPAWETPDPGLPTASLDSFLPVRLVDRAGDWGRILCSNGWSAWVDARLLVSVPDDPPAAGRPLARTADPRPLIARAEDALGRYRRAAEELAGGRADGETFRRRTRGLRVGMVVDGESLWLYDAEHERWLYCDGTGLSTYAASAGPSVAAAVRVPEGADGGPAEAGASDGFAGAQAPHEPTQVVPQVVPPPDPDLPPGAMPTRVVGRPAEPGGGPSGHDPGRPGEG